MFNKIIRAAAMACFATLTLGTTAFAQSVLVVDSNKVIADSKVGKYVASQIQSIETTARSEAQAKLTSIQNKAKAFGAQYDGQKQADLVNNAAFKSEYQQLLQDEQRLQQELNKLRQEMQITRQKAIIPVMQKFAQIVQQVGAERKADIVLDKSQALYFSSTADVSQTVLTRLDQQMTTTPVIRERITAKP